MLVSSDFKRDFFYIHVTDNNIWQLRLVKTHQIMSTSLTEEGMKHKIEVLAKRYKSPELMEIEIRDNNNCILSDKERNRRKEEYKTGEYKKYNYIIEDVIGILSAPPVIKRKKIKRVVKHKSIKVKSNTR